MVKAAFFDIDGTLYSHRTNSIPPSALAALEQLHRRGVRIFLATGRSKAVLEDLPALQAIPFDGAITLNGSYCYDRDGLIHHDPIPRADIEALLDHLQRTPIPCAFIEGDRTYINFHNDRVHAVHNAIHTPLLPVDDLKRGLSHPVYQVLLYLTENDPISRIPMPHTRFSRWFTGGVDGFSATAGKAAGIKKILAHYGISRSEAIAFGDAENDLDMFDAVQTAVAMGNAAPQIRAAADYVTGDVDDDGIHRALIHLGLI